MIMMKEERRVFVFKFGEGEVIVEFSGDEIVDYDCYMEVWYIPYKKYNFRYFVMGKKVIDSYKKTAMKEVQENYGHIYDVITDVHTNKIDDSIKSVCKSCNKICGFEGVCDRQ